jgi:hypothetical protein
MRLMKSWGGSQAFAVTAVGGFQPVSVLTALGRFASFPAMTLILWSSRPRLGVSRVLPGALSAITAPATVGFAEHYLVDLSVASFAPLAQGGRARR